MEHPQYSSIGGANAHQSAVDGRWWTKLSLRLLSIICNIAILGFSAFYYSKWTIGALIMMGPPAVVATLWDCTDALCLCIRRGRDGIHPMACLIFDLILFLGLGAMSGVIAHTVANLDDSGYYFAFFTDENGWEYLHVILGFGILAAIIHLAIFVMACLAVKGLKKKQMPSPPPPRIIYVRTDAHGNPIGDANQQYHMSELPTDDPPPGYSLPSQQGFMQNEDQIHRVEPMVQGNEFKDKS